MLQIQNSISKQEESTDHSLNLTSTTR